MTHLVDGLLGTELVQRPLSADEDDNDLVTPASISYYSKVGMIVMSIN